MKQEATHPNSNLIASAYQKYYADLRQYLLSYTRDVMQAEDMLQDLFIKLLSLDVLVEDTVKNLIFVMAKRMIIDDARHKAFVHKSEREYQNRMRDMEGSSVVRRIEAAQILSFERSRLQTMAPKRARIYEMYRHEDLSAKEIAEQLNLSPRTIETHIYLASKEMRQFLEGII